MPVKSPKKLALLATCLLALSACAQNAEEEKLVLGFLQDPADLNKQHYNNKNMIHELTDLVKSKGHEVGAVEAKTKEIQAIKQKVSALKSKAKNNKNLLEKLNKADKQLDLTIFHLKKWLKFASMRKSTLLIFYGPLTVASQIEIALATNARNRAFELIKQVEDALKIPQEDRIVKSEQPALDVPPLDTAGGKQKADESLAKIQKLKPKTTNRPRLTQKLNSAEGKLNASKSAYDKAANERREAEQEQDPIKASKDHSKANTTFLDAEKKRASGDAEIKYVDQTIQSYGNGTDGPTGTTSNQGDTNES